MADETCLARIDVWEEIHLIRRCGLVKRQLLQSDTRHFCFDTKYKPDVIMHTLWLLGDVGFKVMSGFINK